MNYRNQIENMPQQAPYLLAIRQPYWTTVSLHYSLSTIGDLPLQWSPRNRAGFNIQREWT